MTTGQFGKFGIEWQSGDKIELEEVQRLVESMPKRVSAAIKTKGAIPSTGMGSFCITDTHSNNCPNESPN